MTNNPQYHTDELWNKIRKDEKEKHNENFSETRINTNANFISQIEKICVLFYANNKSTSFRPLETSLVIASLNYLIKIQFVRSLVRDKFEVSKQLISFVLIFAHSLQHSQLIVSIDMVPLDTHICEWLSRSNKIFSHFLTRILYWNNIIKMHLSCFSFGNSQHCHFCLFFMSLCHNHLELYIAMLYISLQKFTDELHSTDCSMIFLSPAHKNWTKHLLGCDALISVAIF